MDLTTGWDRKAEANNDEHHWQGRSTTRSRAEANYSDVAAG